MQSLVSRQVDEDVVTVLHDGNRGVRGQSKHSMQQVSFRAEEAAAVPENKHTPKKERLSYWKLETVSLLCMITVLTFSYFEGYLSFLSGQFLAHTILLYK